MKELIEKITEVQLKNEAYKIDGYLTKRPGEDLSASFERAKAELRKALENEIKAIDSVDFERFMNLKKRNFR